MRRINKELAAQMEACIKQTHVEVTRQYPKGCVLELSYGAACFSGFDSCLSQVIGWGFSTKLQQLKDEIKQIEAFYQQQKYPHVDIELCPFVGNELTVFLGQRGYRITELNQVSALNLNHYATQQGDTKDSLIIRKVGAHELKQWAKQVAIGFNYPEAEEQFYLYARATGSQAFAAFDGDLIVGGAVISMHNQFADLGLASTLPAYRGRGIQKKLLEERLNYARSHEMSWIIVTTEPGSISDANVQKMGFQCAYTRIKMTKNGM